jgi:CoA:oxalate CoA-transferase
MENLPLTDVRVLELAQGITGPFCGKLLAEFGAQVVKVEPLNGDIARRQGPFSHDRPDLESSLLFLYVNTAKQSITLHVPCRAGQRVLEALIALVDVLITDEHLSLSPSLKLPADLIHTSTRPYGLTGPDSDRPASELTLQASGGVMALVGDLDRWPVKMGGEQAHYLAGLNACVATLLALEAREPTGQGQVVDLSAQEALLAILGNIPILYSHLATLARRIGSRHHRSHPTAIFPCRDGFIGIAAQTPQQWEALCLLVDQPELLIEPRFMTGVQRVERADELDGLLYPWFLARSRDEVMHACQARRIPVGLSLTIPELLDDPQYDATCFFQPIDHPSTGPASYPGAAFHMAESSCIQTRAPLLGEHNERIYGGWLGVSGPERARLRAQGIL